MILSQFLHMLKAEMEFSVVVDPGKAFSDTRPAIINNTVTYDRVLRHAAVSGPAFIRKSASVNPGNRVELLHILRHRVSFGKQPVRPAAEHHSRRIQHDEHIGCAGFPRNGHKNQPVTVIIGISPGIGIRFC